MKFYKVYYYNETEGVHDYYFVLAEDEESAKKHFYYRIFTETDLTPDEIEITSIEEDEDEESEEV